MIAEVGSDEVLAGDHCRLDLVERRGRGTPKEKIGQRHFHAVSFPQPADQTIERVDHPDRRVILLRGRVKDCRLAVVEELPFGTGAMHQGTQLVGTVHVHVGHCRMLQLLAVGQNALGCQLR